jgi:hypothetical protein
VPVIGGEESDERGQRRAMHVGIKYTVKAGRRFCEIEFVTV